MKITKHALKQLIREALDESVDFQKDWVDLPMRAGVLKRELVTPKGTYIYNLYNGDIRFSPLGSLENTLIGTGRGSHPSRLFNDVVKKVIDHYTNN